MSTQQSPTPNHTASNVVNCADEGIVLTTINAKYLHTSLALKYLKANLEEFEPSAHIMEFTLQERAADMVEKIILQQPWAVIFACYIWNIELTDEVVRILRAVRPNIVIVLGGPEVSFPKDLPPVCELADHVVCGEGELALPPLLRDARTRAPHEKIILSSLPNLTRVTLPYSLYTDEDIAHRIVYVETSRGCAFGCEFCLSSLDTGVRYFPTENLLAAFEQLWQRGARQFKFIDRTIHLSKAAPVLDFFQQRICPELFIHFEIVPDQLNSKLIKALQVFPPGAVQLEAGVQTFTPHVSARIGRKQNMNKTEHNIREVITQTGVHVHSDLVIGLPGETMQTLEQGFDRLIQTGVHEIQVGILKKLRGAPIARHTEEFQMVYSTKPPYEVLENQDLSFANMQRMKRFSRYFDLVFNNGNFSSTAPLVWQSDTPFASFLHFSDWLYERCRQTASIALERLAEFLFEYLTTQKKSSPSTVADLLKADFRATGRRRLPKCVREFASSSQNEYSEPKNKGLPERQQRHQR